MIRLDRKLDSSSFEISTQFVDVVTLRTNLSASAADQFQPLLSVDEMKRAERFAFTSLRHSYLATRGTLRRLLGRYANVDPASICFQYDAKGKPSFSTPSGIEFNLSHSGDLAVFAFTSGLPLGVDVELRRPMADMRELAAHFFCAAEADELASLRGHEREGAFFRCWTRKEAYIKAVGGGLSIPLDSFQVTLRPDEPARLVHIAGDTEVAATWTLHELCLVPDYVAALAYPARPRTVRMFPLIQPSDIE